MAKRRSSRTVGGKSKGRGRGKKPAARKKPGVTKAVQYYRKKRAEAQAMINKSGLRKTEKDLLKKIINLEKVTLEQQFRIVKQGGIGFNTLLQAEIVNGHGLSARAHMPTRTKEARALTKQVALLYSGIMFEEAGLAVPAEARKVMERFSGAATPTAPARGREPRRTARRTARPAARKGRPGKGLGSGNIALEAIEKIERAGISTKSPAKAYKEAYEKGIITEGEIFMAEADRIKWSNPRYSRRGVTDQAMTNVRKILRNALRPRGSFY